MQELSLTVGRDEAVGVVGESGSGKTTLARALLGAVSPGLVRVSGSVLVDLRVARAGPAGAAPRGAVGTVLMIVGTVLHVVATARRRRVDRDLRLPHYPGGV